MVSNVVHGKVTGQGGCIVYDLIPAASHVNAIKYDHDQGNRHNDTLDQVGGRYRQETAHNGIADNDDRTDDHGHVVIHAKQAGEQGSDGFKAGCGIRNKEDQDDDRGDAHQDILMVMVASG